MSRRRLGTGRVIVVAALAFGVAAGLVTACGEDTDPPAPNPTVDSGIGLDGSTSSLDSSTPRPDGSVPGEDASAPGDAGSDASAYSYTTCKTLKEENPALTSGVFEIDLDNDGGVYPPLSVYCDMTFAGGGWTLIESFTGAQTTSSLNPPTGPDGGYLAASPRPGALGGLAGWVTQELAEKSTQVHIRYSFARDAGAADMDAGVWIMSRAPAGEEVTVPMRNLRNLDTMSKGTDGGFGDWTGPQANATKLSWVPTGYNCLNLTNTRKYPDVLWSCGNFESLNVISDRVSWRWNDGSNQPIEVYVR